MSDTAAIQQQYSKSLWRGTIYDAQLLTNNVETTRVGAAIQISASGAGTVLLKLQSGFVITVNVAVGDSIYPYQVRSCTSGTAVVTAAYKLYE